MRALRATVPLSKLMAADKKICEYFPDYAISVASALSQPLMVPNTSSVRTLSVEDWLERGKQLAAMTPSRFSLPPDSMMDLLDKAVT